MCQKVTRSAAHIQVRFDCWNQTNIRFDQRPCLIAASIEQMNELLVLTNAGET
jgi:hypothetical protein